MKKVGGLGSGLSGLSGLSAMGISGVTFAGFLDDISNLSAVYSVRRTLTSYTGSLLRLRRDSDNAESDFGYDINGDLDTAAITTWLGGATGFVVTRYDQTGNNYDITNAAAAGQPRFDTSVAKGNNRPGLYYDIISSAGLENSSNPAQSQPDTMVAIGSTLASGQSHIISGDSSSTRHDIYALGVETFWRMFAGTSGVATSGGSRDTNVHSFIGIFNGVSSAFYVDGNTHTDTGDAGAQNLAGVIEGNRFVKSDQADYVFESIIFSVSAPIVDLNFIGNDQKTYYGITWANIP